MLTYHVSFNGRKVGAIGARHHISVTVEASNLVSAAVKAMDGYEHIDSMFVNAKGDWFFAPCTNDYQSGLYGRGESPNEALSDWHRENRKRREAIDGHRL